MRLIITKRRPRDENLSRACSAVQCVRACMRACVLPRACLSRARGQDRQVVHALPAARASRRGAVFLCGHVFLPLDLGVHVASLDDPVQPPLVVAVGRLPEDEGVVVLGKRVALRRREDREERNESTRPSTRGSSSPRCLLGARAAPLGLRVRPLWEPSQGGASSRRSCPRAACGSCESGRLRLARRSHVPLKRRSRASA